MANQSAGETGLSDSGPSSRAMTHGVNGITPSATNFLYCSSMFIFFFLKCLKASCCCCSFFRFHVSGLYWLLLNEKFCGCFTSDQEGAAYFGGLEEALMHGVAGIRSDEERKCKPLQPNASRNQSSMACAPTQTWKRGLNWSPTSGITQQAGELE
ncbi:hypothetical protein BHE74_00022557 [Ensete ventricosum]|nr:hypothetical protein GW17_00027062 [Ensete ventricosum]RWW69800.1 hypothetical protein BHE74_00022557 [Ensete ventricosum]RZR81597.1 hypothetical protein BHM03_00007853 [Ensete ventricosum]